MNSLIALCAGTVIDVIIGDPHGFPHIVRAVGLCITGLEKALRRLFPKTKRGELLGGGVMAALVLITAVTVPFAAGALLYSLNRLAGLVFESLLCWQLLAARSLRDESMTVYRDLRKKDLKAARHSVSMIVGRDTALLDEQGVTKAAVETVAENASDGVIAPLLSMAFGGAWLGMLYKAVNTMDSMVGYKNDRYLYWGRAAARLDDAFNYIPARLSAVFMVLASPLCGLDGRNAARIYRRDRRNHPSPNSAQTESVCAGALRVELAGPAYYGGVLHHRQTIGDPLRPVVPGDIRRANRLMLAAAGLAFLVLCGLKLWLLAAIH